MDELRLPPAPPAGDDVRARVLARVLDELDQVPAAEPARRRWLPAAAAVAGVLVVGAAVLTTGGRAPSVPSAGTAGTTTEAPFTTVTPPPGVVAGRSSVFTMDGGAEQRCARAAATRPDLYGDPSTWSSRGGVANGAEAVFEVTDGVLCRTTPTSVHLSLARVTTDPTAIVVDLGPGTVGVLGPRGTQVAVDPGDGRAVDIDPLAGDPPTFVHAVPSGVDASRVRIVATAPGVAPLTVLVGAAEQGLTVVDRPAPAQDRSSEDGVLLDRCLAAPFPYSDVSSPLGTTVPDPEAFAALPRLTLPDGTVAVPTTAPGTAGVCVSYGDQVLLAGVSPTRSTADPLRGTGGSSASTDPTASRELVVDADQVLFDVMGGAHVAVLSVDPSTASVEVTPGPGAALPCRVQDGVAFCLYRAGGGPTILTARSADGTVTGTVSP